MFEIINNIDAFNEVNDLKNFVNYVISELKLDNCNFNIIFINNEEIKKINSKYRNIDKETDVISFALEDNKDNINNEFRLLGDIYISYEKAKEQAEYFKHSVLEEIKFLSIHGILHLLGFDHMNEHDEKIMFDKQEELLKKYEISKEKEIL